MKSDGTKPPDICYYCYDPMQKHTHERCRKRLLTYVAYIDVYNKVSK